jgi:glycosyltransferase involved in cell wall biosynthesis
LSTKKVFFIVPYPFDEAPSQRFRFEQYLSALDDANIIYKLSSFYTLDAWQILYKQGNHLLKFWYVLCGFANRFLDLFKLINYDLVFIHREASPIGPPVFEWIVSKMLKKKIIYDFDDAIWLPNTSQENNKIRWLKCHWKVKHIIRWSWKISAGNQYLLRYAKKYNLNAVVNPTTLKITSESKLNTQNSTLTIGWTGTHSTIKYLDLVIDVIDKIEKELPVRLKVISNKLPAFLKINKYKEWDKSTETEDLLQFDIGIMPLPDNEWAYGKCGFKALQYMALGIPIVASPIGVNGEIIKHGENGLLATTHKEWRENLEMLIKDHELRSKLGKKGKETVELNYSTISNRNNFLSLFD